MMYYENKGFIEIIMGRYLIQDSKLFVSPSDEQLDGKALALWYWLRRGSWRDHILVSDTAMRMSSAVKKSVNKVRMVVPTEIKFVSDKIKICASHPSLDAALASSARACSSERFIMNFDSGR